MVNDKPELKTQLPVQLKAQKYELMQDEINKVSGAPSPRRHYEIDKFYG